MLKRYDVSIIGSGNVAWHLAIALESAGHAVQEVYSPVKENAQALAKKLYHARVKEDLNFVESKSTIFFIAVKDDAIIEVVKKLNLPTHSFVAHTSGTTSIEVLRRFENRAVFYPLQTFSKIKKLNFGDIPICLEFSNSLTEKAITQLADTLSPHLHNFNSEKRKVVHLAAVYACNFTNHLLGIASHILKSEEVSPTLLHPLIAETINNAMRENPFEIQTGPAIRKDQKTIEEHIEMLEDVPEFKNIYKAMTESIIATGNAG